MSLIELASERPPSPDEHPRYPQHDDSTQEHVVEIRAASELPQFDEPILDDDLDDADYFKRKRAMRAAERSASEEHLRELEPILNKSRNESETAGNNQAKEGAGEDAAVSRFFADFEDRYSKDKASQSQAAFFRPPELDSSSSALDRRVDAVIEEDIGSHDDSTVRTFASHRAVPKLRVTPATPPPSAIAQSKRHAREHESSPLKDVTRTSSSEYTGQEEAEPESERTEDGRNEKVHSARSTGPGNAWNRVEQEHESEASFEANGPVPETEHQQEPAFNSMLEEETPDDNPDMPFYRQPYVESASDLTSAPAGDSSLLKQSTGEGFVDGEVFPVLEEEEEEAERHVPGGFVVEHEDNSRQAVGSDEDERHETSYHAGVADEVVSPVEESIPTSKRTMSQELDVSELAKDQQKDGKADYKVRTSPRRGSKKKR